MFALNMSVETEVAAVANSWPPPPNVVSQRWEAD